MNIFEARMRQLREQSERELTRHFNESLERMGSSARMTPDGGQYRDYSSFGAQDFLTEIGGFFTTIEDRKKALETYLNSPVRNQAVSYMSLSERRRFWIVKGAGALSSPKDTEEAESVLLMLAEFRAQQNPNRKPEEYSDMQAFNHWESYWKQRLAGRMVFEDTQSSGERALKFLATQRERFFNNPS